MSKESKRLIELIDEQQSLLNSIKQEAKAIDSEELAQQNEILKEELQRASKNELALKNENEKLKNDLNSTKAALFTKLANEKLSVFKQTQKRLEKIYYSEQYGLNNRLEKYEKECKSSIEATIKTIEAYGSDEFEDILNKLNSLKAEADERSEKIKEYKNEQAQLLAASHSDTRVQLKNEELTEEEIKSAMKQKSFENFIGLNVLSKAGILLFIIGIILLGRFAFVNMTDTLKGGIIYLLGFVLLAVGEIFHKKEKTIFSTTLLSGGVSTLYAAAATCYFAFDLYNVKVTFIICIIITIIAIALSNQVKSQIVCSFAAVGGYLPVVAIYMIGFGKAMADITFLPVSSIYFCLFAIVLFFMTYNKKWYIAQFIGYALHLIAIGGIAKCAYTVKDIAGYEYALPLACVFAIASFVLYLLMPGTKILSRKELHTADSVLLGLNTVSGAISVSITIHNCIPNEDSANRAVGFVFIAFSIIYAMLTYFSIKEKTESSAISTIVSSISALIFSMMVIPFIFGFEYAGIGWAVEGIILALISIHKKIRISEIAGLVCMLASIYPAYELIYGNSDILQLITVSIIICAFWVYVVNGFTSKDDSTFASVVYTALEIGVSVATALYFGYLYNYICLSPLVTVTSYFTNAAITVIGFMVMFTLIRTGILRNKASVIVSDIAGIILFFVTFIIIDLSCEIKEAHTFYFNNTESKGLFILNIVLLLVINICVQLYFSKSVMDIINRFKAPAWVYTIIISVSSLMLITASIMYQFKVQFSNVIISTVYIAVACVLLVIGFKKNYTVVRTTGLILILCAFAKLCFIDTLHLDSTWKIASYFAFGAILICISYIYQRFSKKIEANNIQISKIDE